MYLPRYSDSHALIIGIDVYACAPPLAYAKSDAAAVADLLLGPRFGFSPDRVTCLYDEHATTDAIRRAYASLADAASRDDRVIVFFAGHGATRAGRRGEVGYLVPTDGDTSDLASLIPWDELTRGADLIPAKHVLFIMDACFGGLAVSRALPPGTSRFLKDMLQRYARQVLSAGKADEVVADSGGPRQHHSVFTGHLLDALEGAAATPDGVLTANGLMAYVYDRVAKDKNSRQTPHYGFTDGDGDMVLTSPYAAQPDLPETENDVLVAVPASLAPPAPSWSAQSMAEMVKEYLSEGRYRIRLDDLLRAKLRSAIEALSSAEFTLNAPSPDAATVEQRLTKYQESTADLATLVVLVARWGDENSVRPMASALARLADLNQPVGGMYAWLGLRWFPFTALMYYGGIAALSADRYEVLAALWQARSSTPMSEESQIAFVRAASGQSQADTVNAFKLLPGHERQYTPRSEFLYKHVQPLLEDHLFLGQSYETLFDRFEVLQCVAYASEVEKAERAWGPLGRFGWKYYHSRNGGPFGDVENEARAAGAAWAPVRAGLFRGSVERYLEYSKRLREELLAGVKWF